MLATAVTSLPTGEGWSYEFKWDGVRALIDMSERGIHITSRLGNEVSAAYPELVALAAEEQDGLLDGEIVAFVDGRPSFELLQSRMHVRSKADAARLAAEAPVAFVAFDVLRRFGVDLTPRPYSERRATLERWLAESPGWTLSPAFDDGAATEAVAREHGLEGVVAKRLDSRYRPGVRNDDWRKLRFLRGGEFVVIGWEAAPERPNDLSSLILGRYRDGSLDFAGKVGSGLSASIVRRLRPRLVDAESPAVQGIPPSRGRVMRWVEPTVVVDVEYADYTSEGRLRQPVFRGIRADKKPSEAVG